MTIKRRNTLEIWNIFAWLILGLYFMFLVFPLFKVLKTSVISPDGGLTMEYFKKFFSQRYYFSTLSNSFKVSMVTTIFALLLGVPLAYFYNLYQIKGKRFLQVMIILSSMSAPFIGAYAWILLLGRNGAITIFLEKLLRISMPSIYGFGGIVLVLVTRLFPMIFLYVNGALRSIDNSVIEASQSLGTSKLKTFIQVIVPLCMPSILAGALIVFMRALADFGTPLLIGEGYRTFPVEIYNNYVGETSHDYNFAAAISVIAIIITALVFAVQKFLTSRYKFTINAMNTIEPKKPKLLNSILMHGYAYLLVTISMLPQVYLAIVSFKRTSKSGALFLDGYSLNSYRIALSRMGSAIANTIYIGVISVVLVVLIAIVVSYLVVRRSGYKSQAIDALSMLPYIFPGSVVGIALIMSFNTRPLVLTGTAAIIVISMIIRRIPYTIRSSVAILGQIPMSIEEAALSLGASKMKTFFTITVPMMANGIISGALLSWVTIISELSTSIILYTSHTITLTVAVYVFVSRGTEGPAAAMATILTLVTTLSLLLFMRLSKDKDITF